MTLKIKSHFQAQQELKPFNAVIYRNHQGLPGGLIKTSYFPTKVKDRLSLLVIQRV